MTNVPSTEIEEDEIICNCFQITESTIRSHIAKNDAIEVKDVTLACEAGGNCGSCHILIQLFIDQNSHKNKLARTPEPEEANLKNNKKSFWKKLLSKS
jgi:NifU-like protein